MVFTLFWVGLPVSWAQENAKEGHLEACLALRGADLHTDIEALSRAFFEAELAAVDLPRIVDRKWFELGLPELLEREVDRALEGVRADTGLTERFTASFSPAQATELAERVAYRAFSSDAFRSRLETLAGEVAADFTRTFTTVAARSAGETTACLQRYLGAVYGGALSRAFEAELRLRVEATGAEALTQRFTPAGGVGVTSAAGVATVAGGYVARAVAQRLSAQVTRRVAGNIAARIAGRAGTSVIPVVGWAVGGGLIVWDVGSSAVRGPFPAIRRQLAGEATQRQIQSAIVASLQGDLPMVSTELSATVAAEVSAQWEGFTERFEGVLELAETHPPFGAALAEVADEDLYTLAGVVDHASAEEVVRAARGGDLKRVVRLGENAVSLLETVPSLARVLAWSEVAGNRLDEVIDFEIHRHKAPEDFSQRSLERLLDTDNFHTVAALSLLQPDEMNALLGLSHATLNALAAAIRMQDFGTVAFYAGALPEDARNALVVRLLERPSRVEKFAPKTVKEAVVRSREPLRAVTMVGSEPAFGVMGSDLFQSFGEDAAAVLAGTVPARLLLVKYSLGAIFLIVLLASGATALFVALPLWWLRPRWRRL